MRIVYNRNMTVPAPSDNVISDLDMVTVPCGKCPVKKKSNLSPRKNAHLPF